MRIGVADALGVRERVQEAAPAAVRRPPSISSSLNSLRYIMGCGVMFNHLASKSEEEHSYGPSFTISAAFSYLPATVFFVLAGFSLSASLSARPVLNWQKFYVARFSSLHPMYLLSLLFNVINLLIVCTPTVYKQKFTFQPEALEGTCQSMPVVAPYGVTIVSSILVHVFGLQAWPFFMPLTVWISYYSWFSSVLYFAIFVFPPMHNALVSIRGQRVALWLLFGITTVFVYATCAALLAYYKFPDWKVAASVEEAGSWEHNQQALYALATVLFPLYWIPVILTGMVTYFLCDAYSPNESHSRFWYGLACDLTSVAFAMLYFGKMFDESWLFPEFTHGDHDGSTKLKKYMWSVAYSRLLVPLIASWIAFISMRAGSYTAQLFELPLLSDVLGPSAYGCFLFHQSISQWYFWATRGGGGASYDWWSFRKSYYWFSPYPMPGAWYEYFFVVMLVTMFSMVVNAYVKQPIEAIWAAAGHMTNRIIGKENIDQELSAWQIINLAVEGVTGGAVEMTTDMSLDELGLGSIGLPVFLTRLNAEGKVINLALSNLVQVTNIGELAELVDAALSNSKLAGVGAF